MNMFRLTAAAFGGLAFALCVSPVANAAGDAKHAHAPEDGWPFDGVLGQFEMDSVQRGYQVYKEVCSSCHGMKLMSYRNLGQEGGPFYDPLYPNPNDNPFVKALAAQNEILDTVPNDVGEFDFRAARPADAFRSPYPNDAAARAANNGALPPDLSVITKARHGGASYIYSLLMGYPLEDAVERVQIAEAYTIPASDGGTPDDPSDDTEAQNVPAQFETRIYPDRMHKKVGGSAAAGHEGVESYIVQPLGQYYNPYMPGDATPNYTGDPRHVPYGGFLAMAPQLIEGRVEYTDGTEATPEQMAYDVSQFLAWAGEPKQDNRKSLGLAVMGYLGILAILLWFSYQRIWRNVDH